MSLGSESFPIRTQLQNELGKEMKLILLIGVGIAKQNDLNNTSPEFWK